VKATATAHPNIALIKYWGKRDERLNLPHQSSVSVTLGPLSVEATVEFTGSRGADGVRINGARAQGSARERVVRFLDLVRQATPSVRHVGLGAARVDSRGNFPASAGLASSAAAFAALAVAARSAAGLPRSLREESILARQGSGSACRSISGGFVVWRRGVRGDGRDSSARQLFPETHWPELRLLVTLVNRAEKEVNSRDGMRATVRTSPYYRAWVADAERAARSIVPHLRACDLEAVGSLAERNAWRMHATALAASPPLNYLKPQTLAVIEAVREERRRGVGIWFTLDAGPNPVLLTTAADEPRALRLLKALRAGEVVRCRPGGDARLQSGAALGL
jgi:diphosphomevalonate decarboxylase